MRGTIFTKSKMNYFGSFGRQRTWALLAQGAVGRLAITAFVAANAQFGQSSRQRADSFHFLDLDVAERNLRNHLRCNTI